VPSDFAFSATTRPQSLPASFAAADEIVRRFHERGNQPAISYGIVLDGELVHSAGFGQRSVGGPAPDARTVFRIASMSKSFTASAVLLLRDAGALRLDDPAAAYVPELAGWVNGAADAGPLTIRHLLTMTAGFPTDDPWGDRQQGLPIEDFRALLARGVLFNWAPGTRFEYSNLGYAVLGLVVSAASGLPYDEFVRTRLLGPLGMASTGFEAAEFPAAERAVGYRRGPDGWEELPYDPYGAFAPMGGIFSTVADLAVWSAGFAAAFPPDGEASLAVFPDKTHPLAPASRRQMQLPQVPTTGWRAVQRIPGGPPAAPANYGFGLFVDEDATAGRIVSHSGGYPGFGSNMRWHSASGLAVIALGNGTYSPMSMLAELVQRELLSSAAPTSPVVLAPAPAGLGVRSGAPWPETLDAAAAVGRLLENWNDADAGPLFTANVALDRPYAERQSDLALLRDRIGAFAQDPARPAESDTAAHRRWWLTGERGTVAAAIQLNPQRPPRVQSLTFALPPAPDSVLDQALAAVTGWLNQVAADAGPAAWPESVPFAPGADGGLITRRLRMAAAWTGPVTPGAYQAGDGSSTVSVELVGEHAQVVLMLQVNPATGELRGADVTL
jgi:CubicO group peptidase (beta-lactamase class C family)